MRAGVRRMGVVLAALPLTMAPVVAHAGARDTNPLAGHRLGVDKTTNDGNPAYVDYLSARGNKKRLLAKVALRSRVRWFTTSSGTGTDLTRKIRTYIHTSAAGDPDVVVPLATFRLWPESERHREPLTRKQRRQYRAWYRAAAAGIAKSRVAVVVEPDLALTRSWANPPKDWKTRLELVHYAVKTLTEQPRVTVYIDAGDSDWLGIDDAVTVLRRAGIGMARGFALGATHYTATAANINYGTRVVRALAKAGVKGKRFVIDTADNGRPFTFAKYHADLDRHIRRNHYDNADPCRNLRMKVCDTLGIPPTTRVARHRWHLKESVRRKAHHYADAYLWIGRPWLRMQAWPYCRVRALQVARTTRWQPTPDIAQVSPKTYERQQARCYAAP